MGRYFTSIIAFGFILSTCLMAQGQVLVLSDSLTVYDPVGNIFAQVGITEADELQNPNAIVCLPNVPIETSWLNCPVE